MAVSLGSVNTNNGVQQLPADATRVNNKVSIIKINNPTIKQNNEVKKDIQEIKVIEKDGKAKLNGEGVPENTISTPTPIPTQTPFVPSKEVIYLPTNEQQIINAQKPRPNFAINYPYILA